MDMNKITKEFGKRLENGDIQYAPTEFDDGQGGVVVPEPEDDEAYYSRGWLKVVDIRPNLPGTQIAVLTDWIEDHQAKTITAQYTVEDMPPTKEKI